MEPPPARWKRTSGHRAAPAAPALASGPCYRRLRINNLRPSCYYSFSGELAIYCLNLATEVVRPESGELGALTQSRSPRSSNDAALLLVDHRVGRAFCGRAVGNA